MPESPSVTDSRHHDFLKDAIPAWLADVPSSYRSALKHSDAALPAWYQQASAAQRKTLEDSVVASFTAQGKLGKAMSTLQDIDTFARPLLVKALNDRFKVQLDVNKTFLRLRKPITVSIASITAGWFEALKLPLLQAALHNFEEDECEADAFHPTSGFVIKNGDDFDAVSTPLTVAQFTGLCRSLDIGAKYQAYLKDFLEPKDALAATVLRKHFVVAHRAALRTAAEQALLKKDINDADYRMVLSVIAGETRPTLNGQRVWFRDLSLAKHRLTGVVVFLLSGQLHDTSQLLLYIPNDPQSPLKRYTLGQLKPLFKQRFTARDTPPAEDGNPTAYQRFFSQFVNYADRADYFSQFTQDTSDTTLSQDLAPFAPLLNQIRQGLDPFSIFSRVNDLPASPPPKQVPNEDPYLHPVITPPAHSGLFWRDDFDLWDYLYEQHRAKVYADARSHAVPTADVDAAVRSRKLAALLNIGMLLLTGVSIFVPGLGEVMMAVMAGQLMYETFEGVEEWAEGDRKAAKAHLIDVAENLVFLAVLAGAGKGLGKLTAVPAEPVVEQLQPVTSADGKTRLWKPDLEPYASPVKLAADARPDAHGLYTQDGQRILPLEGRTYRVAQDPEGTEYRIQHPTRTDAYAPKLTHNGEGAWHHEGETPLAWDDTTLLRRLGLPAEALDDEQLFKAQEASGVSANALREAHANAENVPLLLADSLQRFRLHQQVTTFIEQLKSADPQVYPQADLGTQLDLMKRRGLLSSSPTLRVIDHEGRIVWDDEPYPPSSRRRTVLLTAQQLARGEGLREVLNTLQGTDPELVDIPGSPQDTLAMRAGKLRRELGDFVERFKAAQVEERYQKLTANTDLDVQRLKDTYPKLPTPIAAYLLTQLSAEDLLALRRTGRLPDTLAETAQWVEQETRVARAYENLHLNTPYDLDSQRLALRTLETLPGWRRGARMELRQHSAQGPLLDAIGELDTTTSKILVQLENGQFKGPRPTDLYQAILDALSSGERQDLRLADARQLQAAIQAAPLPREALRGVLLEHPVRKPAYDTTMRLLGGGRGYEKLVAPFRSTAQRVRKLYPSFSDAQIDAFIESLGSDVRTRLRLREAEYSKLETDLEAWVKANPPRLVVTAYDRAGGYARVIAEDIKRCWRRESGNTLKIISGMPVDLPALTADFSHVEKLELNTKMWSGNAQTFLNNFRQVKTLSLDGCELAALPDGLDAMPQLAQLSLKANKIMLTPQSAAQLSRLHQLETLELSGNRLGITPDVSALNRLKTLDLSYTGIDQWPTGLQDKTSLQLLDLRNNRLREIPEANLAPQPQQLETIARINGVTRLKGNPFPQEYAQRFDAYWRRLNEQRPDLIGTADVFDMQNPQLERTRALYPRRSILESRQFIWALGDGANTELLRLEQEFETLNTQLNTWAAAGGNANSRTGGGYVRTQQRLLNVIDLDDRYQARERVLKCWRKETPTQHANDGTAIGLELDLSGLNLPSLPELDADFSHVGSLKLSNMHLSTCPEQFLLRHSGVRWLDLSNNQLRELPMALNEMNGLTRLFLQNNQIRLTAETAQVLARRTTLRALLLGNNPLGLTPDFSVFTDMRTLGLQNCGLETFPTGLGAQPLLDTVALRDNRITQLPGSLINPPDAQLAQSVQLTHKIELNNNPLTEQTRQQLRDYRARLEQAGLASADHPNQLVISALAPARTPLPPRIRDHVMIEPTQTQRWTQDLAEDQVAARQTQWRQLREQPGSDGFFAMLEGLSEPRGGHADLQQRVWRVIDTITQNSEESAALREQMFEWAGRATCCDRAGLSFSNVEVMAMVHNAKTLAADVNQGAALIKLSRGLFRLDEVEKTALNDIARRTEAINNNPRLSAQEKAEQIAMLEEVEIRLAYRFGLKDKTRLDLPGQPQSAQFIGLGRVSEEVLKATCDNILKLNNSPAELQALISREFWQEYLTQKYREQFEAQGQPFHERLAALHDQHVEGSLGDADYAQQARDLQAQLAIQEANLIETLTRTELRANPIT
jgi:Leucine-rich repeat (LRR) protein